MPDFPKPISRRRSDRAIRRTDAQRAEAAKIDIRAILGGLTTWHETAPASHKGLLDARVEPERETT